MNARLGSLVALGGGVLWGLCFGRQPLLLLPWVVLAPLLLLCTGERPRRAFFYGWLHGVAGWLVGIPWIQPTLVTYGGIAPALAWVLVVLLAAYLALFQGAFAALAARILRPVAVPEPARGSSVRALAGVPAAWVVVEWIGGHLFGGFPWNLAAYTWIEIPGALPLSSWIGPEGISWLVVFASTGVAVAVRRRRPEPALVGVLAALLLLAVGARYAVGVPEWGSPAPARLLQPNIANLVAFDREVVERNLDKVFRLSEAACDRPGTLLIWPESAAWPYAYGRDGGFTLRVGELLRRGCQVLLNSTQEEDERTYNSALLLNPEGAVSRYDKRHLVPWGEYVPLGELLPFVGRLARAAGDFAAASEVRLLPWGDERIGTAICFESVFADEVAELVRDGATVLVTISNDSWYGDTAAPWQLLRAARFRAAESRRPLLRAAITGVSAVIDTRGEIVDSLGVNEEGVLAAEVSGRRDLSPYSRWPWAVPGLAGGVLVAALAPWRRRLPS